MYYREDLKMDWAFFKKCALEILSIDENLLVDECDVLIDAFNKTLQITKTYNIHAPNPDPKPNNLLSEWPPSDKMYFYHNYFQTSIPFVNLGDHIATFKREYKDIVVILSRVYVIRGWLKTYDFGGLETIAGITLFLEEIDQFFKNLKKSSRKIKKSIPQPQLISIEDIKSFFNDELSVSKYTEKANNLQRESEKKALQTKKYKLETLLKKKIANRASQLLLFQQKYDNEITRLTNQCEQLQTQIGCQI